MPRGGKRIASATSHPRNPVLVIPNNNPTLIVSGRVVVRNDWVCPSYALKPKLETRPLGRE